MTTTRRRILFVTENITLAQVVRLATLASTLDPARYEVHFACSDFEPLVFGALRLERHTLYTIDKQKGLRAAARGERLYDTAILERYVSEERELIETLRPDLIVGDFRLSLAVSAPACGVPLATLINAYWSPYAVRDAFPVPDHPIVALIGVERATRYFPQAMPRVFAHFAAPLNSLRKRYGLPLIPGLLELLTFGDYTLYPDVPELCPTAAAPASHLYLGHIPWSPEVELPEWWGELPPSAPVVYVTLGSSGTLDVLPTVLEALAELPIAIILATASRFAASDLPKNVYASAYVPGHLAVGRAALVITNGGASTGYQALAAGTPVLGLPSNMDQYLATSAIDRAGAGLSLRASAVTKAALCGAFDRLLSESHYRARAEELARSFARYDCGQRFSTLLTAAA